MAFAVGIDLGTTNTVVAAVRDGVAVTLPDPQGERLLPSVISLTSGGSVLVGRQALDRRLTDPQNTVYSTKRLIGRAWSAAEVQKARGTLPFRLDEGPKSTVLVAAGGDTFSLPEISAFVLRQAKATAEAALGIPVTRAVITVPANFNDLQRAATKTAGRLAGLEVLRILNEPTAAALAYGPATSARERVAIYDLGGGTFDVTVLDLIGNVFEVIATAGDTALGGDDIDLLIAHRMSEDLLKRFRVDARANPTAIARLRILAEEMKRELSDREERSVNSEAFALHEGGPRIKWRFRMTRAELESESLPLIDRTLTVCAQALDSAGSGVREVDRVILVGGATRMPMVARKVEQFFGRSPVVTINPDEVVALGAAIQAELLDRARPRGAAAPLHPQIGSESVVRANAARVADALDDMANAENGDGGDVPNLPIVRGKRPAAAPLSPTISEALTGVTPPTISLSPPGVAPSALTLSPTGFLPPTITIAPGEVAPPATTTLAPARVALPTSLAPGRGAPSTMATLAPGRGGLPTIALPPEGVSPPTITMAPGGAAAPTITMAPASSLPKTSVVAGAAPSAKADSPAATLPPSATKTEFLPGPKTRSLVFDVPETRSIPPFEIELEPRSRAQVSVAPATPAVSLPAPAPVRPRPAAGPPPIPTRAAGPPPVPQAVARPRQAPLLIDVTPLSLNVETVGGFCDVLIDANTPIPCDRTRSFSTASDGQTTVCVRVAQGESKRFNDNTFLGEVELSGMDAAPRGEAPIAVTFEIDADGILNVRARDVKTGRETVAQIQLAGAESGPSAMAAMRDRQAKHPLSGSR